MIWRTRIIRSSLWGKADADTGDCGTAVSQCSEYPTIFMKNNPWSHIKSEKDFLALMIKVEDKAWSQENIYRKKIGLPALKKRSHKGLSQCAKLK